MRTDVTFHDWQLLLQFGQIYRGLAETYLDKVDIHRGQASLICCLTDKDSLTQSEIAEALSVQGATVTNMLQRMEESGLVIRSRDKSDNRLVRVSLTDLGRAKQAAIHQRFEELEAVVFAGMSEENRALLRQLLHQLLDNMEA
jgi:DNA-binding MarR family transcriptional regulator